MGAKDSSTPKASLNESVMNIKFVDMTASP